MIYADASALAKLVTREAESDALRSWLVGRAAPVITSELGRVEVLRTARRADGELREARLVMGDVLLVPLDRPVLDLAAEVGGAPLRTLDALHLASALLLGDALTAFVAYDARLLDAARGAGLPVSSPT